ncbi:Rossmann-fold NAD(P)-binding domain-containing protein [Aureivirga marina]|uniref:SDR family NAD(P)-dependent oxidoreductase n=1 Tax=Aureivirga marina TaxID=1182451 RepID=UPI0018CB1E9C|nr:SDR family NAD(P)-dependent oxidoreductase [Aureivirga marina]
MTQKQISILGCGWLGFPLAQFLIEKGSIVKGSTTSENKLEVLKKEQIQPFLISINEEKIEGDIENFLKGSEIIFINFPPRRIPNIESIYPKQLDLILKYLKPNQKVIFISSTSVYQNTNGIVTEDLEIQPETPSGKALKKCEEILQSFENKTTIVRFSGLMGKDRKPGRFLANKLNLNNGNNPINMIHLEDCIGLINQIIEKEFWNQIVNGCADKHPTRKEFYTKAAEKLHLPPPTFSKENGSFKIVSNKKSKEELNYLYQFSNPLDCL